MITTGRLVNVTWHGKEDRAGREGRCAKEDEEERVLV